MKHNDTKNCEKDLNIDQKSVNNQFALTYEGNLIFK